jgi:hypothetical protein
MTFALSNKTSLPWLAATLPDLIIFDPPPVILPKLCVLIELRIPFERAPASKIIVTGPGSGEAIFTHSQVAETEEPKRTISKEDLEANPDLTPLRGAIIPAFWAPFVIEKVGWVKVRLEYGDEIIKLGALHIKHSPPGPSSPPTAPA